MLRNIVNCNSKNTLHCPQGGYVVKTQWAVEACVYVGITFRCILLWWCLPRFCSQHHEAVLHTVSFSSMHMLLAHWQANELASWIHVVALSFWYLICGFPLLVSYICCKAFHIDKYLSMSTCVRCATLSFFSTAAELIHWGNSYL